ncbi:MAG: histidine phosphatase family protein [Alphaproteobacteria bacterium]|nr:histidine phosphatase family protein [Alphaproteobacteria bacterium]
MSKSPVKVRKDSSASKVKEGPFLSEDSRHLYLMRHGKAQKSKKTDHDVFRSLDRRGCRDVKKIRKLMRDRRLQPDLILCSPAVRTMETLMKLKKIFTRAEIVFMDALYMADADEMLQILRRTGSDKYDVLVIGHNPGLQEFLPLICDWDLTREDPHQHRIADGFPTSALACLEVPEGWQKLGNKPVQLTEFIYSSDL